MAMTVCMHVLVNACIWKITSCVAFAFLVIPCFCVVIECVVFPSLSYNLSVNVSVSARLSVFYFQVCDEVSVCQCVVSVSMDLCVCVCVSTPEGGGSHLLCMPV